MDNKNIEKNIEQKADTMALDMTKPSEEGRPMSVVIRERVAAANKRYFANDNIGEFFEPGDMDKLLDEVEEKLKGVLDSMVIDTENDHNTQNTARRVAKMYLKEVFKGRYTAAPTITEFPNVGHLNELMIVGPTKAMGTLKRPLPR